ncbi:putative amino acid transporter, transmembrane domain-containing protein [Rosa chinensis]|uniref:Putative amino acid transporter, transmembrane domain-containing protein n=1 Tax=Rosa chinensis TaxID=74649 RepID=A0A2P6RCY1_ROSCH|nr:putative amino acid transporter, transmembrane domain-containing protein [Rosa chinensis]
MFNGHGLSVASCIFLLVPVEIGSCWIGSVSALTSLASICNLLSIMVNEHIQQAAEGEFSFRDRTAITSNIGGVAICRRHGSVLFWGLGMTLALEASMEDRTQFPSFLAQAFTGIGIMYASLGFFGYMAYGDQTRDIITLNLPQTWSSKGLQEWENCEYT